MITTKVDLSRLKKTLPEIKEQFKNDLPRPLTRAIEKDILKSVSPNRSKRFPRYSPSYDRAKKKAGYPRTVNLKLSGKMLKSLTAIKRLGRFWKSFSEMKRQFIIIQLGQEAIKIKFAACFPTRKEKTLTPS